MGKCAVFIRIACFISDLCAFELNRIPACEGSSFNVLLIEKRILIKSAFNLLHCLPRINCDVYCVYHSLQTQIG